MPVRLFVGPTCRACGSISDAQLGIFFRGFDRRTERLAQIDRWQARLVFGPVIYVSVCFTLTLSRITGSPDKTGRRVHCP